jgi:hypothetical protein
LRQGLQQLAEEGATQVFFPERSNDIILGAVGVLQFDVKTWGLFLPGVYPFLRVLRLAVSPLRRVTFFRRRSAGPAKR